MSNPSAVKKPAVSSEIYDAPTHRVFPGGSGLEKISSLVMQHSFAPGASGYDGRPPTAMTTLSVVISCSCPFFFVAMIVFLSLNRPYAFTYVTFFSRSVVRYPKFNDPMWF